jgi:UPF0716 protein FxsA
MGILYSHQTFPLTDILQKKILMRFMLAVFIGVPLLEMAILIEIGGVIGALPTIALVVLTATIGIWLLRIEGIATLSKLQDRMNRGEVPGTELLEGVMLLIGGALLLTPGFVTDTIGFACLIPTFRRPIAKWLIAKGLLSQTPFSTDSTIIEGEFEAQARSRPEIDKSD